MSALPPGQMKLRLCAPCAARLREIKASSGTAAMVAACGDILCETCKAQVPGYVPGQRLVMVDRRPS